MELHILEHSLKVASIEKEGIQICTHGLVKLAFLASRTRCKFFSLTETPEDYTLIVDEEGFKEEKQELRHIKKEPCSLLIFTSLFIPDWC
uniref:Cytosolic arginine sensor for mTORC1 subunit 2 n=1 Tax=Gasterosteus aculeatus aculeatus TaxID=481459 RepID=A0AAQ4Q6S7_GASAC